LRQCQARIRHEAEELGLEGNPVGTTMTLAYIVWPNANIIHVGDSRAYLYREHQLRQLTGDDTIAQRMLDREVITPDRIENTPYRHILTNAIGGETDALEVEHHSVELRPGDHLLLCTDGITRHLDGQAIRRELDKGVTAATRAARLVDAALRAGGEDNATAVVASVAADR
jgi:protein phosphatase